MGRWRHGGSVYSPCRYTRHATDVVDEQHQQHDKSTKDVDRQHSIHRVTLLSAPLERVLIAFENLGIEIFDEISALTDLVADFAAKGDT